MVELLSRFGFATWLRQFEGDAPGGGNELDVETVTTRKQLDSLVEKLGRAGLIAFDVETTSLEAMDAELVGFSFAVESGQDRKSTRLNSSHVAISYAVFCLKKKM